MNKIFQLRLIRWIYLTLIVSIYHQAYTQVADTSTVIAINLQTVPSFSSNVRKTELVTHYNFQVDAYVSRNLNEIVKNYCTANYPDLTSVTIDQVYESLRTDYNSESTLAALPDIRSQMNRDVVYAICAAKLFRSENEAEINANIRLISKELREIGYTDFENDFMPFLARMLSEHRELYFDLDRITIYSDAAKGVVTPMEILNTHRSLDVNINKGVCRDVEEYALRLMRQSFDVYYNQDRQSKLDPDDYIFLQAWVTPSSQHISVLLVDPANPRNGYDLDWGRIYKRESQDGLETPNNVGLDIRLFKFDEEMGYAVPFMLHKTERGRLFDINALSDEEYATFNNSFARTFYSDIRVRKKVNDRWSWNASAGRLSGNLTYVMGTLARDSRKINLVKYLNYQGKTALQPQYYEDSEIRSAHLSWYSWESSHNVSLVARYLAKVETNAVKIGKNLSLSAFSHSQLYMLLNASLFNNTDTLKESRIQKTGDGNIFTTYGAHAFVASNSGKVTATVTFQKRSFVAPKEVRLLSPNPSALLGEARIINAADNLMADVNFKGNRLQLGLKTIYEYDILKAQQLLMEVNLSKIAHNQNVYGLAIGGNCKLDQLDYYWYAKDRLWLNLQYSHVQTGVEVGGFIMKTRGEGFQTGLSVQKRL